MAEDNPSDLQPYDDLEASAASCFGVARFEDEKFVGVTLQEGATSHPDTSVTYKHQSCFNQLFNKYWAAGKKDLSVSELKEFTGEFNRVCLGNESPRQRQ